MINTKFWKISLISYLSLRNINYKNYHYLIDSCSLIFQFLSIHIQRIYDFFQLVIYTKNSIGCYYQYCLNRIRAIAYWSLAQVRHLFWSNIHLLSKFPIESSLPFLEMLEQSICHSFLINSILIYFLRQNLLYPKNNYMICES